jgi:hypothetical protein
VRLHAADLLRVAREKKFCTIEHCSELVQFWNAVEYIEATSSAKLFMEYASKVHQLFVAAGAMYEVGLRLVPLASCLNEPARLTSVQSTRVQ